ncbi:hypothetical protein FHS42_003719 [Streptomyces zagrosensis]|uniref:Uncharacterized protein n=1 Tax=Streptomyces zagrosensis TaxID=1042984 RepID=A0A7W9V0B7_9ACTN|nr:hypothetical protein [Streptomyces zagrosensis]
MRRHLGHGWLDRFDRPAVCGHRRPGQHPGLVATPTA